MSTNPVGKGTKTVGINMPVKMANALDQRAKSMQISMGKYCKIILNEWLASEKKLTLTENRS